MVKNTEEKEISDMFEHIVANMATKDDFSKLDKKIGRVIDIVAPMQVDVETLKTDVSELKDPVSNLSSAVDHLASVIEKLDMEYVSIKSQLERYDSWFKIIAKKTGVALPE